MGPSSWESKKGIGKKAKSFCRRIFCQRSSSPLFPETSTHRLLLVGFPTYADEQCTHVLTEEDFFSTEEREGVDRCIGVICSSVSYELFPNVHEDGGVGYQFLYEGDELKCYEHGLLIESVE